MVATSSMLEPNEKNRLHSRFSNHRSYDRALVISKFLCDSDTDGLENILHDKCDRKERDAYAHRTRSSKSCVAHVTAPHFDFQPPSYRSLLASIHEEDLRLFVMPTSREGSRANSKNTRKRKADTPSPSSSSRNIASTVKRQRTGNEPKIAQHSLDGSLSMEVLYKIFGYLEPYDILKLSRANKKLRGILMSRSAEAVWKASRRNVDLPDPFPDMSEPAFANLLFYPHCKFCDQATNDNLILWSAGIRCCRKCDPIHFRGIAMHYFDFPKPLLEVFPRYCYDHPIMYDRCLEPEAYGLLHQYLALSPAEVPSWLAQKAELVERSKKHASVCKEWLELQEWIRGNQTQHQKDSTWEEIVQRLHREGWSKGAIQHSGLRHDPVIEKYLSAPLSERGWGYMKSRLTSTLQKSSIQHLYRLRQTRFGILLEALEKWRQANTYAFLVPPVYTVAMLPPFRAVIEDLPLDAPEDESIFEEALSKLPQMLEEWNAERTQEVLRALQKHQPEATEADLHNCTSLFRCSKCRSLTYAYPGILAHSCFSHGIPEADQPDWWKAGPDRPSSGLTFKSTWERMWRIDWDDSEPAESSGIEIDQEGVEVLKNIAAMHRLDSSTMTIDDMFFRGPQVKCLTKKCKKDKEVPWYGAVEFHRDCRLRAIEKELLNDEDEWRRQNEFTGHDVKPWYLCKLCPWRSRFERLEDHLVKDHDLEEVENITREHWEYSPLTNVTLGWEGDPSH
ncbi:hypothetical protein PM082_004343 [Marasmius tenuissimus]|nr:hypothetical protein PM082_004343 [Marasmius tenuissimus]